MTESIKSSEFTAEQKARQESLKLLFEVYKHITTLSTGAIVILTTFLEKLFKSPKGTQLVTIALVSFLASIMTSLVVMAHLANEQQINKHSTKFDIVKGRISSALSPISFIIGIICLTVFTVINLSS